MVRILWRRDEEGLAGQIEESKECAQAFGPQLSASPLFLKRKEIGHLKKFALLAVFVLLFFFGCKYEAPLTKEHDIAIDPSVLGLWELIPVKGGKPDLHERVMILKYTETEYLIHYPIGKDGMYFRGYPVRIGDVPCVQIQLIGTEEGNLDKDNKELFQVVSYQLSHGELIIKTLNTDLVDDDVKSSEALRKAFLKHKDHKDLFQDPGRFRKIEKKR
jgi:hypothetical protein